MSADTSARSTLERLVEKLREQLEKGTTSPEPTWPDDDHLLGYSPRTVRRDSFRHGYALGWLAAKRDDVDELDALLASLDPKVPAWFTECRTKGHTVCALGDDPRLLEYLCSTCKRQEVVRAASLDPAPQTAYENAKLCYVSGCWAYFTTQALDLQTGDDWNDTPYEHNAGRPYEWAEHHEGKLGRPHWSIYRVAWEGEFETPCDGHINSRWCVDQINRGDIAWLRSPRGARGVMAGTTVAEFRRLICAGGGQVYECAALRAASLDGPRQPAATGWTPREEALSELIWWMLGERDALPNPPEPEKGKPIRRYWWRKVLRERFEAIYEKFPALRTKAGSLDWTAEAASKD